FELEERGFLAAKNEGALLVQPDASLGEDDEPQVTVTDEGMPFAEVDELRALVQEGRERGYLTPEEIAAPLQDIEPSREQVSELHQYLQETGIDIVSEEEARASGSDSAAAPAEEIPVPRKVELDV